MKHEKKRSLSIRQQLPLLICLLLLVMILLFGTISYLGIRRASMAIGQQRLESLTEQLCGMFRQSAHNLNSRLGGLANSSEIVDYLETDPARRALPGKPVDAFQKLLADTLTAWVELRDPQGKQLLWQARTGPVSAVPSLSYPQEPHKHPVMPDAAGELLKDKTDSNIVGDLYHLGDSLYYPIIARSTRDGKTLGYLLSWRAVRNTSKTVTELSRLLGSKAALYVGNDNASLWTDMVKPVPTPPVATQPLRKTVHYTRPDGKVIAFAMAIPGTKWLVAVELSQDLILEAAGQFLHWLIAIGAFLILSGSLIAWLISRNFTRPLDRLMHAASAIEAGDYSSPVDIDRSDELGRLATSFNSMAAKVHRTQEELEHKVKTRTEELEAVNKELEAFSYSVSHDLRAPLRAVSGYAMMLQEDYENTFDDEARRITNNILINVKMMGRLIDDLLAFSRLGKREVRKQPTDMQELASVCVDTLSPDPRFLIDVADMPSCQGDPELLKQVWMNLIGNAIKYSSKKPDPRITIGAITGKQGPTYFVRDNGAGFDSKYADKLFKVFQRLHSQDEFEGTGIGLALVKRILDKHRGRIWAESTPGSGAVFYFKVNN